jgi:hypothetical protein
MPVIARRDFCCSAVKGRSFIPASLAFAERRQCARTPSVAAHIFLIE